jgi:hypothetical protein
MTLLRYRFALLVCVLSGLTCACTKEPDPVQTPPAERKIETGDQPVDQQDTDATFDVHVSITREEYRPPHPRATIIPVWPPPPVESPYKLDWRSMEGPVVFPNVRRGEYAVWVRGRHDLTPFEVRDETARVTVGEEADHPGKITGAAEVGTELDVWRIGPGPVWERAGDSVADDAGTFEVSGLEPGWYLLQRASSRGNISAEGHVFEITQAAPVARASLDWPARDIHALPRAQFTGGRGHAEITVLLHGEPVPGARLFEADVDIEGRGPPSHGPAGENGVIRWTNARGGIRLVSPTPQTYNLARIEVQANETVHQTLELSPDGTSALYLQLVAQPQIDGTDALDFEFIQIKPHGETRFQRMTRTGVGRYQLYGVPPGPAVLQLGLRRTGFEPPEIDVAAGVCELVVPVSVTRIEAEVPDALEEGEYTAWFLSDNGAYAKAPIEERRIRSPYLPARDHVVSIAPASESWVRYPRRVFATATATYVDGEIELGEWRIWPAPPPADSPFGTLQVNVTEIDGAPWHGPPAAIGVLARRTDGVTGPPPGAPQTSFHWAPSYGYWEGVVVPGLWLMRFVLPTPDGTGLLTQEIEVEVEPAGVTQIALPPIESGRARLVRLYADAGRELWATRVRAITADGEGLWKPLVRFPDVRLAYDSGPVFCVFAAQDGVEALEFDIPGFKPARVELGDGTDFRELTLTLKRE